MIFDFYNRISFLAFLLLLMLLGSCEFFKSEYYWVQHNQGRLAIDLEKLSSLQSWDAQIRVDEAVQLIESQDYNRASFLLKRAHRFEPHDVAVMNAIAVCKIKMKSTVGGIEYLEKAIAEDSMCVACLANISLTYYWINQFSKSLEYVTMGMKLDPDNQVLRSHLIYTEKICKESIAYRSRKEVPKSEGDRESNEPLRNYELKEQLKKKLAN